MAFPPRFLDELRERLTLSEIIGRRIRVIRAGREFKACCPFHHEKTPSFTINDQKGFFHCFAGETGVLLRDGVRPIGELAGGVHTVLTRGGVWTEAAFKSYGVQPLLRIELSRNGLRKIIHATAGHRWFVRGVRREILTSGLRPGHRLEAVLPTRRADWALDADGVARLRWTVQSVTTTDRVEEVFCAEVPGEAAFALEDNILTGNCFGCGAHGDVVGFVMRHDNLSFPEAVESLAAQAGLPVPQSTPEDRQREEKKKTLHDLVERACQWFEGQLREPAGRAARAYLAGRGLNDDAVARFRLGFAPADRNGLVRHLAAGGFPEADMVAAGLARLPEDGGAAYGFFRSRVMFPVADRRGRIVAFGGRIMDGDGPKYVNTSETALFHKGSLLYGLSRARQAAADGQPVVVAEGYMDVIALALAGFGGAVAPLGTALTELQIQELWKLIPVDEKEPYLCFDGDSAGRRAAWRAVERILPHLGPGKSARVAFLPEGEDPDSLIRGAGPRAMTAVLEAAIPLSEALWRMESEGRRLDTPETKAALRAALDGRVNAIADPAVREYYRQDMRRRMADALAAQNPQNTTGNTGFFRAGGGRPWVPGQRPGQPPRRHVVGQPGQRTAPPPGQRPGSPKRLGGGALGETILLAALINHPALFDEVGEAMGLLGFPPGLLEDLRSATLNALAGDSGLDAEKLYSHLHSCGLDPATLLPESTYVHARFARPTASLEEAREGWFDTWSRVREPMVRRDFQAAAADLRRDASPANLARFDALREELRRLTGALPGADAADDAEALD